MTRDGIAPLGIPLWDQPLDGEHAPGLFLRLAEINGYPSTDDVARETRLTLQGLRLGRGVGRLAAIVCSDEGRVSRDGFAFARGDGVLVRGERIGRRRDLHRKLRRVCPACIAASRHQRFWFDLSFVETCPEHGCRLVGRCPCPAGRLLSWRDGRIGGCRACEDGDVATQPPVAAEPAAMAVDRYFLGRLGVVKRFPNAVLDPLAMADAIDVLERVGALALGGYRSRWPGADDLGVDRHRLLAEGYAVLAGGCLPGVLDRVFEGFRAEDGGAPGLTTAYGWFYHWLNGKGGKRFSPGLSRMVLEHAETRFVVDKRARAKVLPPTSTCTLKEATARCGVTILVMRDILEQRGLLSRDKVRGMAFRIPEAKIRAIEAVMRDSVDANGAAALLGTTWKVVKDLNALGSLKPWITGGRSTKHAYVFRRAEVQGVLDRLAIGLPERPCVAEDEATLTGAAHAYAVPLAVLCREALEGRLACHGRLVTGRGLQTLIVRREEVLAVRRLRASHGTGCRRAMAPTGLLVGC